MSFQNVVLIVADTLRAKNLPSYGGDDSTTEFLKEQQSVDRYYSNSPWTVPAHATLFSGSLPSEHGTTTQDTYFESRNDLVKAFNENGYTTVGITENPLISEDLGFGSEFDYFGSAAGFSMDSKSWSRIWKKDGEYKGRIEKYADFLRLLAKNRDFRSVNSLKNYLDPAFSEDYNPTKSRLTVEKALRALQKQERTFLFANLMPVHAPYTFDEKEKIIFFDDVDDERISRVTGFDTLADYLEIDMSDSELFLDRERAYNASIRYLDSLIEGFYNRAPDDTVFVVVGDHGELIGEYEKEGVRLVDHHFGTFKELVEVPLYIFSKSEDLEFKVEKGVHDHIGLHEFLLQILEDGLVLSSKEIVRSEYFGKSGFNRQFGQPIPQEFEDLFDRKSFSMINREYKYDLASEGRYLWGAEEPTESKEFSRDMLPKEFSDRASLFYGWKFS